MVNALTPLYASFHDDMTFYLMWTEYDADLSVFHARHWENQPLCGKNHGVLCQPQTPPPANAYTVSTLPWFSLGHLAVHSFDNKPYYFPSVEAGKNYTAYDRELLPLSLTCHHATTDGYHVHFFLTRLQEENRKLIQAK